MRREMRPRKRKRLLPAPAFSVTLPTATRRVQRRLRRLEREGATQRLPTLRPDLVCENESVVDAASESAKLIIVPPDPSRQDFGVIVAFVITGATHQGFAGTPWHGPGMVASPAGSGCMMMLVRLG